MYIICEFKWKITQTRDHSMISEIYFPDNKFIQTKSKQDTQFHMLSMVDAIQKKGFSLKGSWLFLMAYTE